MKKYLTSLRTTLAPAALAQKIPPTYKRLILKTLPLTSVLFSILILYLLFHAIKLILILYLLIFAHELGHLIALRIKRIPARGPFFVPLLGAFVTMSRIKRGADVAFVMLAGPFLGGLAALVCLAIASYTSLHNCHYAFSTPLLDSYQRMCLFYDTDLFNRNRDVLTTMTWLTFAHGGLLFNLLNLIPLLPLDGGKVAAVISRWLWLLGIPLSCLLLWTNGIDPSSPVALLWELITLILILSGISLTALSLLKPSFFPFEDQVISPRGRIIVALAYLALAAALGYGYLLTDQFLNTIRHFSLY